jgi:RNA polymerase sigma factor (sigma-70 family)
MPIRENEKFCKCFVADTEGEADQLLKEYDYILKLLANKVSNLTGLDKEDLYQEGIIGLARARRDFDEERSDNFKIFAVYKIKDAMREFGTTQAMSIRVPQYTKDAMRLANVLKECLVKAGEYPYNALVDMWGASSKYTSNNPLDRSIRKARQNLMNLAQRSHTSVRQLLDRSEMMPFFVLDTIEWNDMDIKGYASEEDDLIKKLYAGEMVSRLRNHLSEEEYNLLVDRYVKGMTVRELAPVMGISAPHVSDKTQALLQKVRKLKNTLIEKREPHDESNTNTEDHESGYTG